VAAFFAPNGSLIINNGTPAIGRPAITATVQTFMTAFPDMRVRMGKVEVLPFGYAAYHWTLTGTDTSPGGTGKPGRIEGFELWHFGADGLIRASVGHFDNAEYVRLEHRAAP